MPIITSKSNIVNLLSYKHFARDGLESAEWRLGMEPRRFRAPLIQGSSAAEPGLGPRGTCLSSLRPRSAILLPMDSVSAEARSRIMAAIRGRDTLPELILRSALHARGLRFRVDARDLPGRPDLKLTKYRALVFVHGCFWHGHDCAYFRAPRSNRSFWTDKVERNRARDLRVVAALREAGWRVCVVWECALKAPASRRELDALADAVARWVRGRRPFLELFDRAAVGAAGDSASAAAARGAREPGPRRGRAFGRREDEALFAAERRATYRGLGGMDPDCRA